MKQKTKTFIVFILMLLGIIIQGQINIFIRYKLKQDIKTICNMHIRDMQFISSKSPCWKYNL